jgi:hypothetical protein
MLLQLPISRFHAISACILLLIFATVRRSGADCEALRSRIEGELQAKGVQSFRLTIVPSNAESNGKTVGTCNGGAQKIIYSRGNVKQSAPDDRHSAPVGPTTSQSEVEKLRDKRATPVGPTTSQSDVDKLRVHLDWAFSNKGTPCADCNPKDRPACCSTCSQGGLLPRDQIAAQAAIAARKVGCEGAVGILLETQCQNPEAAKLLALHKAEVCELLRRH